jgi:hypothetical protein
VLNLSDKPYTGVIALQQDYPLSSAVPEPVAHSQVASEETILDEGYRFNTSILPLSENQALRRKSWVWASGVPAHGYLAVNELPAPPEPPVTVSERSLDNGLLRVDVSEDGSLRVEERVSTHLYEGLHQLVRHLEQGDSYNAAPVPGAVPETAKLTTSEIIHPGPLCGVVRLTYQFESIGMTIETDVTLEMGSRRLLFESRFVNTTPDHKIQAVFPMAQPIDSVLAEGHFSPVVRHYDPHYRILDHMPAPKLKELQVNSGAIQRFAEVQDQTFITEGLTEYEVEGNLFKLTLLRTFGWLSKADTGVRGSHAGPPLDKV